jgi:hypothetical protein
MEGVSWSVNKRNGRAEASVPTLDRLRPMVKIKDQEGQEHSARMTLNYLVCNPDGKTTLQSSALLQPASSGGQAWFAAGDGVHYGDLIRITGTSEKRKVSHEYITWMEIDEKGRPVPGTNRVDRTLIKVDQPITFNIAKSYQIDYQPGTYAVDIEDSVKVFPGVQAFRLVSGGTHPTIRAYADDGSLKAEAKLLPEGNTRLDVPAGKSHKMVVSHTVVSPDGQRHSGTVQVEYPEGSYLLSNEQLLSRSSSKDIVITSSLIGGKSASDVAAAALADQKISDPEYLLAKSMLKAYHPVAFAAVEAAEREIVSAQEASRIGTMSVDELSDDRTLAEAQLSNLNDELSALEKSKEKLDSELSDTRRAFHRDHLRRWKTA